MNAMTPIEWASLTLLVLGSFGLGWLLGKINDTLIEREPTDARHD